MVTEVTNIQFLYNIEQTKNSLKIEVRKLKMCIKN